MHEALSAIAKDRLARLVGAHAPAARAEDEA
jgi:hypothetical protein